MKGCVKGGVLMSWFGTSLVTRCRQQHETVAGGTEEEARGNQKALMVTEPNAEAVLK